MHRWRWVYEVCCEKQYMWLNISKGTSYWKTRFWVTEVQSQNIVLRSSLRFYIHWNLQYLLSKLLFKRFMQVCRFHVQWTFKHLAIAPIRCLDSKSTFHWSIMPASMKLPYLENAISNFKFFCTEMKLKEQPFRKYHQVNFELLTQLVHFDVLSHMSKVTW